MPETDRQTGQIGCAQSGDFADFRAFHAGAENIGLELHQEVVGDRAAVNAQGVETDPGVSLHRFQHVAGLIGNRLQGGANNMVGVHAAGQAEDRAAGIRVPVRGAEAGKRRNDVHAVGILHFGGEIFGIERVANQLHLIAQPLNRGARHKHRAFQRIVHLTARAAGDSRQQAVR